MTTTEIKQNVVTVGSISYEPETMNSLIKPGAINFADKVLIDYAKKRWNYSQQSNEFEANTPKEQRERAIFDGLYMKYQAILASDRHVVFGDVQIIVDLTENDPASFEAVYQAAITANPGLAEVPEVREGKEDAKQG